MTRVRISTGTKVNSSSCLNHLPEFSAIWSMDGRKTSTAVLRKHTSPSVSLWHSTSRRQRNISPWTRTVNVLGWPIKSTRLRSHHKSVLLVSVHLDVHQLALGTDATVLEAAGEDVPNEDREETNSQGDATAVEQRHLHRPPHCAANTGLDTCASGDSHCTHLI